MLGYIGCVLVCMRKYQRKNGVCVCLCVYYRYIITYMSVKAYMYFLMCVYKTNLNKSLTQNHHRVHQTDQSNT